GRNFANNLWNIGRFLLGHLGPDTPTLAEIPEAELTLADRWILARAEATIAEATTQYGKFRLNDAAAAVYHFLGSDLADWYVEQVKPRLYGTQPGGEAAKAVAAHVTEIALRLLHPVMPFITETLWQRLPHAAPGTSISVQPWPQAGEGRADAEAVAQFEALQAVIGAIRVLRAEYAVAPGQVVNVTLVDASPVVRAAIAAEADTVRRLAKVGTLALDVAPDGASGTVVLEDRTTVSVPLGDLVDLDKECARLAAEADKLEGLVRAQEAKLSNAQFVERAPPAIVEKEREKAVAWAAQAVALREQRRALGCPD